MEDRLGTQHRAIFCIVAIAVWVALGWPVAQKFSNGIMIRGSHVPVLWFLPYGALGVSIFASMVTRETSPKWSLLLVQLFAVTAMAILLPWAGMSEFLVIIAWQVALLTTPRRSLVWVFAQTSLIVLALAQALNPDFCWVIGKALAMQLLLVFTAQIMRKEALASEVLSRVNAELQTAQNLVAVAVRDAERLRISRELHDTWGHELTALGLQLEIASHVADAGRAKTHIGIANALSKDLLTKVRDVVGTLRESQNCELREELAVLASSVPVPKVHIEVAADISVGQDQAHTIIRCAQESVTNAVRHAKANNLWLRITSDDKGIRLVAHDDGLATFNATKASSGSGLKGMRERVEGLGGYLNIQREPGIGFTVDAWLPRLFNQPA